MSHYVVSVVALLGLAAPCLAQGTLWSLEPTEFSVGGSVSNERYVLSDVVGATLLPDGRVVIADRFQQGLRAYSPVGEFLTSVGREGEGPGEFEHIRGLGHCRQDHIVAFDLNWQQEIYTLDLELVESRSREIPGLLTGAYQLACHSSGHFVASGWGDFRAQFEPGNYVATAPVVLARDTQVVREYGERLSSERVGTLDPSGQPAGSGPHPFGRQTSVAIGENRVYLGDASDYVVEVSDFEGNPLPELRWVGPDLAIRRVDWDVYERASLEALDPQLHARARRRFDVYRQIERFPAYDVLHVDLDDRLWVRHFPRPRDTQAEWRVFDSNGRLIGQLRTSLSLQLLEIGSDYVLAVERDDFDVETVRRFDLRR